MSQQILQEQEIDQAAADRIATLHSVAEFERADADGAFARLGPAEIEGLIALLQRENRKRPWRFWIAFAAVVALVTVLPNLIFPRGNIQLGGMIWPIGSAVGIAFATTRLQRRAAATLAQCDDIRAVGALAEALDSQQDATTRAIASSALARLLPQLRASDSALLNEEQYARLVKSLEGHDTALVLAVLRMLEQLGDEKALPHVRRLAAGKGMAKRHAELQQAAETLLPALEERIEREKQAHTLLRAAAGPEHPAEALLRPAHGVAETAPDTLVRPVEATDEESPLTGPTDGQGQPNDRANRWAG